MADLKLLDRSLIRERHYTSGWNLLPGCCNPSRIDASANRELVDIDDFGRPVSLYTPTHGVWILTKPTLKQILDALIRQVLLGKSHLGVSKGLLNADPVILDGARTFFGLTIDGGIEVAQMAIAKLYDHARGREVTGSRLCG